jgi:hypothetical protein
MWTQVLEKGKQFLLLVRHPPCYSWTNVWWLCLCLNDCICSVYDIGCKVLSMKMNYLASFKHKHKHQKLVMNISYPTFIHCSSLFSWKTSWPLFHSMMSGS